MSALTLTFPQPHVAQLSFDLLGKRANVLSTSVMEELAEHLQVLRSHADLQGVILTSGKPETFIAGADIREFVGLMDSPDCVHAATSRVADLCRRGQAILQDLAALPAVTIAAIEGACLGGGLELALACDRRIVALHPKTQLGLPEVKLGLIPGWGGCGRLPRRVGLPAAVEMITLGTSLAADRTLAVGLADGAVASDRLLSAAIEMVAREHETKSYLRDRSQRAGAVAFPEVERDFLRMTATTKLQSTAEHEPAAMSALNLLLDTAGVDLQTSIMRETAAFSELFGSPANRALVHVFFLQDHNKHAGQSATTSKPVASLSVLGAGIMGIGIAAAALKSGLRVRLGDADQAVLPKAAEECLLEASFNTTTKSRDSQRLPQLAAKLSTVTTDAELAASDVVIEAITENLEIKVAVLRRLEALLGPEAFLASNTSSIPITKIGAGLARPERFCGMHFFNPVKRMRLVEVIRGGQTSDETVAAAVALGRKLGKMPIVVKDGPGFLVNRLLSPYLNEAIELLHDGHTPREIDDAAVEYGMPLGPLALYDLVGLDTAFYAGRTMYEAFPDRVRASPLLPALIKRGRLGRKNGFGFYAYRDAAGEPQDDPAAAAILLNYVRREDRRSMQQLQDRLLLSMLLEACRVLEEGRVDDARDIDLGVIFGLGFPAFRGGILHWAQQLGGTEILRKLDPWRDRGGRFDPPQLLLDWAAGKRMLTA